MGYLPYISTDSHTAIVAAKDETIRLLTETVARLEETIATERASSRDFASKALDTLKPAAPASQRRVRSEPSQPGLEPIEAVPIDLTLVDPTDNEALAYIARQELTPGSHITGTAMIRTIERLRGQVIEAHKRKSNNASQPVFVPQRISDKIADAERAGVQAAAAIEVGT